MSINRKLSFKYAQTFWGMDVGETSANTDTVPFRSDQSGETEKGHPLQSVIYFQYENIQARKTFCSTGQVTGHSSVVFKRLVNQLLNCERAPVQSIYAGNFHFFFTLFLQWDLGPPVLYHWTATPACLFDFVTAPITGKTSLPPVIGLPTSNCHLLVLVLLSEVVCTSAIWENFSIFLAMSQSKWLQTYLIWKCTILSVVKDQDVCSRLCLFTILATPEHCTLSRLLWGCLPLGWELNEIYSLKFSYSLYKYRHY